MTCLPLAINESGLTIVLMFEVDSSWVSAIVWVEPPRCSIISRENQLRPTDSQVQHTVEVEQSLNGVSILRRRYMVWFI